MVKGLSAGSGLDGQIPRLQPLQLRGTQRILLVIFLDKDGPLGIGVKTAR